MPVPFRIAILWISLAVLAWQMIPPTEPAVMSVFASALRVVVPIVAVWLTASIASSMTHRITRFAFWTITSAAWFIAGICAAMRYLTPHAGEQQTLAMTGAATAFFAIGLAVKRRLFPEWNAFAAPAVGPAFVALGLGVFAWCYEANTRSISAAAEARWTEIGLPLTEFEKTLIPIHENPGSQIVRQVLREQVGQRFYKEGTPAAAREPAPPHADSARSLVDHACNIIFLDLVPADEVEVSADSFAAFEPHADALAAASRRILDTAPATWAFEPREHEASAPNFLGIRMFSQLVAAESIRRLQAQDEQGAERALAAGLHVQEGLAESPFLVSLMIRVAVKALLAPKQAYLPATDDDGFERIARETAALDAALRRTLQYEAWIAVRHPERLNSDHYTLHDENRRIPKWAARLVDPFYVRRQSALAGLNLAEHVAIRRNPDTLALDDFGAALHDAITAKGPNICEPNITRAAMRIYATQLLCEQSELIRRTRSRLAVGLPLESRNSVVFPAARWILSTEPDKHSVAFQLVNAPKWIASNLVTGPDFWILPLDGSAGWEFRAPSTKTPVIQ